MNIQERTLFIKSKARELGFSFCGISKADFLQEEAKKYETWLKKNMHGEMDYMNNNIDKRLDPRLLVNGAKSIVSLLYNYYTDKKQKDNNAPKISIYAYGKDYHKVVKKKLKLLMSIIKQEIGDVEGKFFVDSAPVLERAWAKKSGLGWVGKNTNLINKKQGSFFFISQLIIDLDLAYDGPIKDYCGTCTQCIDSCPTEAIVEPYVVDGSKCISYFTIELKDSIPNNMKNKFDNWMFGCDICQDVCPWNKFSVLHNELEFNPSSRLLDMTSQEWDSLNEDIFNDIFKSSAVKRTKFKGLKRNISFLKPGLEKN